jgi:hypothetical protein
MWYSVRSFHEPYRMGYAESADGLVWERKDSTVGIYRSADQPGEWDSEMICYPNYVSHRKKEYLFYNGNQHGKSGFGYASR